MSQYYQVNLSELLDLQNVHFVTQSQSQESQPILMTAHDQSEQLIVQEDPNQHIVYSPNKQNETQYVIQQTEDQSSLQDLQESFVQQQQQQVQSQPTQQTAQSVYYSSSAEVQQSQPVYLNQNLIQSPQQVRNLTSISCLKLGNFKSIFFTFSMCFSNLHKQKSLFREIQIWDN